MSLRPRDLVGPIVLAVILVGLIALFLVAALPATA
jgi:hypothetical protein